MFPGFVSDCASLPWLPWLHQHEVGSRVVESHDADNNVIRRDGPVLYLR